MDDLRLCDYENVSRDNVIEFRFEKAQVKKARTKYAPRVQKGTEYPKGDIDCTRSSKNIYSDAENFSTIPIVNAYRKCHVKPEHARKSGISVQRQQYDRSEM